MRSFPYPAAAGDPVEISQPGENSALNHQNSCPARTIMVVEDERVLRQALCKMLRKKAFCVVEADDGLATTEVLRRQAAEIDLVPDGSNLTPFVRSRSI
jgi:hypothetical protein